MGAGSSLRRGQAAAQHAASALDLPGGQASDRGDCGIAAAPRLPKVAGVLWAIGEFCKYAAGILLDHSPDVSVRMLGMYGRALSFGVVAEAYERFRPAYPV